MKRKKKGRTVTGWGIEFWRKKNPWKATVLAVELYKSESAALKAAIEKFGEGFEYAGVKVKIWTAA